VKKIQEPLGLVLVGGYKNWPNMVLTKYQTTITFVLAVRIRHIVYGFEVEKCDL